MIFVISGRTRQFAVDFSENDLRGIRGGRRIQIRGRTLTWPSGLARSTLRSSLSERGLSALGGEDCRTVFASSLYTRWTSPKVKGGRLGEPKWLLEGSEKGCFSLWKITRNSTGNEFDRSWTTLPVSGIGQTYLSCLWSDLGAVKWRI